MESGLTWHSFFKKITWSVSTVTVFNKQSQTRRKGTKWERSHLYPILCPLDGLQGGISWRVRIVAATYDYNYYYLICQLFSLKKCVKNMKNSYYKFPDSKVMSSNCLFCLTNSPEPKDIQFIMMKWTKATNPHIWEAKTSQCLVFSFDKSSSNRWSNLHMICGKHLID